MLFNSSFTLCSSFSLWKWMKRKIELHAFSFIVHRNNGERERERDPINCMHVCNTGRISIDQNHTACKCSVELNPSWIFWKLNQSINVIARVDHSFFFKLMFGHFVCVCVCLFVSISRHFVWASIRLHFFCWSQAKVKPQTNAHSFNYNLIQVSFMLFSHFNSSSSFFGYGRP